jgi:hypothetical protein
LENNTQEFLEKETFWLFPNTIFAVAAGWFAPRDIPLGDSAGERASAKLPARVQTATSMGWCATGCGRYLFFRATRKA